jgi:hypothetical protein
MIGRLPLLRSLDPWHQRIGYLGVAALQAIRDIDTPDALNARIDAVLFEKIYAGTSRHAELWPRINPERQAKLLAEAKQRSPEDDPAAILRPLAKNGEWFTLCELWLNDDRVPSAVGALNERKSHRVVDLAKMVALVLPTYELSEAGYLLRVFLQECGADVDNPLVPMPSLGVRLLYLRLLFEADCLWPTLLVTMADDLRAQLPLRSRSADGAPGLLRKSIERFLATVSEGSGVDDINELRPVREYLESVEKSMSTEENYLRPRMELLLDLGLVRRTGDSPRQFVWSLTEEGFRMADLLRKLSRNPSGMVDFLDRGFFSTCVSAYGVSVTGTISSDAERFLWFARAFSLIGREYGFTPGRTVSVTACLLALETGRLLEVNAMAECVYRAPNSDFAPFLRFSGGSRFDREFLIRVQPGLEQHCLAMLGGSQAAEK